MMPLVSIVCSGLKVSLQSGFQKISRAPFWSFGALQQYDAFNSKKKEGIGLKARRLDQTTTGIANWNELCNQTALTENDSITLNKKYYCTVNKNSNIILYFN